MCGVGRPHIGDGMRTVFSRSASTRETRAFSTRTKGRWWGLPRHARRQNPNRYHIMVLRATLAHRTDCAFQFVFVFTPRSDTANTIRHSNSQLLSRHLTSVHCRHHIRDQHHKRTVGYRMFLSGAQCTVSRQVRFGTGGCRRRALRRRIITKSLRDEYATECLPR